MRALLLAAGAGTRLRPLTDTIPKCLVPIHGRPLLDYWIERLLAGGIDRILVNTHWLPDQVRAHIAGGPWKALIDITFEPQLLGTGGTVLANRAFFGGNAFLVAHADNLTDLDVAKFAAMHARRPPRCMMTMLAFRTDDPRSCGVLELDEQGVVSAFHEKVADPPSNLANGAVYIAEPELLDRLAAFDRPVVDLSVDVIPQLMGRIFAVDLGCYHRDIGTAESLRRAHLEFGHRARGGETARGTVGRG